MSALKIKARNDEFNLKKIFSGVFFDSEKDIHFLQMETNGTKIWTKIKQKDGVVSLSLEPASRIPSKATNQIFSEILEKMREENELETLTQYAKEKWVSSENEIHRSQISDSCFEGMSIEIGFGKGTWLLEQSRTSKWLGIEQSRYSVDQINKKADNNLRIIHSPASLVIERIPERQIERYVCICPDPWPKKRHQKRIWLDGNSLKGISRTLKDGGSFSLATDHEQLAGYFTELLEGNEWFDISESNEIDEMISFSKYAQIGKSESREMHKWHLVKKKHPEGSPKETFSKDPVQLPDSFEALNQLRKELPEIQSEHGVLKVKELASNKDSEMLLSLIYVDGLGNSQPFLYVFDGKRWQFDEFTKPAIDYGLMNLLSRV